MIENEAITVSGGPKAGIRLVGSYFSRFLQDYYVIHLNSRRKTFEEVETSSKL